MKNSTDNSVMHPAVQDMRRIVASVTLEPGVYRTLITDLSFCRCNGAMPNVSSMFEPSLGVIVQGGRKHPIDGRALSSIPETFSVSSLERSPSSGLKASSKVPCLSLVLKLDLRILAELMAEGAKASTAIESNSAGVGTLTPQLLSSLCRLVELLEDPDSIPVMWPLLQREIHYRLLTSDQAPMLRRMASVGSKGQRTTRAVDWIKQNYATSFRVDELANRVQMGVSTLHTHFKQLIGMSPLQYQKLLRLNEARNLMLNSGVDAATAAFKVGYGSASHFSRDYGRQFGTPPKRDVMSLRREPAMSKALT